jgi:TonB-linked SusC/RagA family outer membrane protein
MQKMEKKLNLIKMGGVILLLLAFSLNVFARDNMSIENSKGNLSQLEITQQRKTVRGVVMDELGDPLPGVTIMVEGATRGATTYIDGTYTIEASDNERLIFSFIGMESQTIVVGDRTEINVVMGETAGMLEEYVVMAFAPQRRASVIGAVSTLPVGELRSSIGTLSTGLAGQLAGVVAMQRTGEPGAGADFWIRGISSFGSHNRPLMLVDGVERDIDLVDVEDIASLSILKDATATALYGVRGANGIILITTKRGTDSPARVSARVEYGMNSPTRMPKMANAEQWIRFYNDISMDATGRLGITPEQEAMYLSGADPDLYPNVDWMRTIFKNMSNTVRANVNVSGGNPKVRYYVGGSFYSEGGILNIADTRRYDASMVYQRFNFRTNIDINITPTTELGLSISTQYDTRNRPGSSLANIYAATILTTPVSTPPIFSDGTLARPANGSNPYFMLNNTGYSQDFNNNAQSLMSLTQDLSNFVISGLRANVKFSWDAYNGSVLHRRIAPSAYYATGRDEEGNLQFQRTGNEGSDYMVLTRENSGSRTINFESSLIYDQIFSAVHRVNGLFLFNMRERTNNFPGNYIAAFPFRNIGIAGRATYSFDDRYFAEFNFGYNGSENFSPRNRFGFFPSYAVGYMVSNEKFWNPVRHVVSELRLKASTGQIGNDQIGGDRRFAFNTTMLNNQPGFIFGSTPNLIPGIATGIPGNEYVSWENATKNNIGIELAFFNSLRFQMDYFYEDRSGIYIQQESVPSVVGLNVLQYVNLGKMKNQGFDGSLQYERRFNDWYFSGRANFTFNRNEVLYDDRPTPVWAYQSAAGFPFQQQRGLIAIGLFESEEDIANSPRHTFSNVRPGDIKYKDINGDGVIDAYDEVAIGYSITPEINYGFGLSVGWRGFDASAFFQGVGNVTRLVRGDAFYGASNAVFNTGQIYSEVADLRWTLENPNPNARYPRMSMTRVENNQQPSTFWQRDMSFMRLKNAEIGYTLPKRVSSGIGLSSVRVYAQGVNLLTFSGFKLWDPELTSDYGNVYPQMRTITLGMNINF